MDQSDLAAGMGPKTPAGNNMEVHNISSRQHLQLMQCPVEADGTLNQQEMNRRLAMLAEEQVKREESRDPRVEATLGRGQAVQRNAHRAKFISFNDSMRLN